MSALIVCPEPPAAQAGLEILRAGGNAVDAAIATAYAQAVTNPIGCGIGGFALIHIYLAATRQTLSVHGPATIGSRPLPEAFQKAYLGRAETIGRHLMQADVNQMGPQSVMVPGFVAATAQAYRRFGSGAVSWAQLLRPAIQLAREGFAVYPYLEKYYWFGGPDRPGYPDALRKLNNTPEAAYLYLKHGRYYLTGELLIQAAYAQALEQIAAGGAAAFYAGDVARAMLEDFERRGAFITAEDLRAYRPSEAVPLVSTYRGYTLHVPPPPCHGIEVLQMLNLLEGYDLARLGWNTPEYIALLSRVMCAVFAESARLQRDSTLVSASAGWLVSKEFAAQRRREIDAQPPGAAYGPAVAGSVDDSRHTTHVTVVDHERNVVAMTHSIGSVAGSGVVTPGLGFLYNNLLGHFSPLPGQPDSIVPGKRMEGGAPVIVLAEGEPVLALGSSGGSRLVTAIVQSLVNTFDFGMTMQAAVSAPRFHSEEPGLLFVEPELYAQVGAELEHRGFKIQISSYMGCNQALSRDPVGGHWLAGTDPRGGQGLALCP